MSQLTQRAITESTFKLAAKRPINKIPVRDIVNDCGITRNTFYYYYRDIYDVLDRAFREEINKLIDAAGDFKAYDEALFNLGEFIVTHKSVLTNIYVAVGDKKMKTYLYDKLHKTVMSYIKAEAEGLSLAQGDIEIIAVFYEEAIGGLLVRWLRGDLSEDFPDSVSDIFQRVRAIFSGHVRLVLENYAQKNNKA